jgi:hypothetical protein
MVIAEAAGLVVVLTDKPEDPIIEVDTPVEPGYVRGKVLTDTGAMVGAGIIIEDEAGNTYRTLTNPESGYNLKLKPGTYNLYFTKGTEYSVVKKTITVESYKMYYLQDVRLVQLFDSYELGWIAGDLHQHTFYSDGTNSVEQVLLSNITTGLYYGFLSDHNSAMGLSEWLQGRSMVANVDSDGTNRMFNPYEAVEVTTEYGHYQSLGAGMTFDQYEVVLRDVERAKPKAQKDEIIKNKIVYIAEEIKRAGGVAQINHPYSSSTMGFSYWEIAEHFDTIEIWNGVYVPGDGRYESSQIKSQNFRTKLKWFELLNEIKNGGKFFPGAGGTDNHDVTSPYKYEGDIVVTDASSYEELYQKYGKYSGQPTTYVKVDGEITQEKILSAIKAGHSFVSNGPVLIADVDGSTYGETVSSDEATSINIKAFCRDGLESIRIVKNGQILQTIDVNAVTYDATLPLSGLASGDWIVIEACGAGIYYAITNPIFIG